MYSSLRWRNARCEGELVHHGMSELWGMGINQPGRHGSEQLVLRWRAPDGLCGPRTSGRRWRRLETFGRSLLWQDQWRVVDCRSVDVEGWVEAHWSGQHRRREDAPLSLWLRGGVSDRYAKEE